MQLQCQLQVELWEGQDPKPDDGERMGMGTDPFHNKGHRATRHSTPTDSPVLRLWGYKRLKSPGVPLFWIPTQRHQLELLFCYLFIALRWNYFKDWDIWELWYGKGQASEQTWSDCVSVGCVAVEGLLSQLKWYNSDCQSRSWVTGKIAHSQVWSI